jgi:hypothetical protein
MGVLGRFSGVGCRRHWPIVATVAVACAAWASSVRAEAGTIVVPRVSGGLDAAYARLHAAGLPVSLPAWTFGPGTSAVVTRTIPRPGTRVAPGTTVTVHFTTTVRPGLRGVSHLALPHFVGERLSAAARWATIHHVSFLAHLGALRRGDAPTLLTDYVITAQRAGPTLTVWARQPPPPPPPAKVASVPPPPAPATTTPPPPPPTPVTYYQNPVYSSAFPDPFVLDNGNTHDDYWVFGTGDRFPVLHSPDLVHWTQEPAAMTSRPTWVVSGDWHPWAPSVIQTSEPCPGASTGGCYVMYYVGGDKTVSASAGWEVNCIGVATATQPGGPYTDQGPLALSPSDATPIGCGDATGMGNIDPSPFIDPSTHQAYLYVSTERGCTANNPCARQSTLSVIPLDPSLLRASAPRQALFGGAANTWEDGGGSEGPTVEGPFMESHDGTYYLFYSGGNWGLAYGMGYATAQSPTGPFTKSPANPFFAQNATVLSPGGGDQLVTGPHGGLWLVYHARANSYNDPAGRTLRIDPFTWKPAAGAPDVPVIAGPTSTPQSIQP